MRCCGERVTVGGRIVVTLRDIAVEIEARVAWAPAPRACHDGRVADNVSASLRAECARCGTVEVPIGQARLVAGADGVRSRAEFRCPRCGDAGAVEVDERAVRLLLSADIPLHAPRIGSDQPR